MRRGKKGARKSKGGASVTARAQPFPILKNGCPLPCIATDSAPKVWGILRYYILGYTGTVRVNCIEIFPQFYSTIDEASKV